MSPLAGWSVVAVFVLMGAALFATVWSTRATMTGAIAAVGRGEAVAVEGDVQVDLRELDGALPTPADLQEILGERGPEGLRYIAMYEGRTLAAEAGVAVGGGPPEPAETLVERDGRLRVQLRPPRRARSATRQPRATYVIEVEPVRAHEVRAAAARTLWIGGIAAFVLLGVAIAMIVRESRRNAEARAREHEQRLASLGEMSAVLAHEIKNPLASLKGNAQLLVAMIPDGDKADKARAKAARVVDEAMRLEKLVVDLLAFVRLGTIERTPIDLGALAREAAASVSPAIALDTAAAPATWPLDGGRVREVLVNLLDNAVAAGPPVACTIGRAGARLRIVIADRGPGVPADERDAIFEPFVTKKTQGTGLGLAVVRRIVELHGGTIAITDNPGGGAIFTVEIPET